MIDVSDPTDPNKVSFYDTEDTTRDVYISGSYAYVADGSDGLYNLDISYFTGIEKNQLRQKGNAILSRVYRRATSYWGVDDPRLIVLGFLTKSEI